MDLQVITVTANSTFLSSPNYFCSREVISMSTHIVLPRFVRLRDAAIYLGMDRHRFNREVRTQLQEIPLGKQGVAFDRLDLDAWADHYKECVSRPKLTERGELWVETKQQVSSSEAAIGALTSKSLDDEFEKVLEQLPTRKLKPSSLVESKKRDKHVFLVSDQKGALKKQQ